MFAPPPVTRTSPPANSTFPFCGVTPTSPWASKGPRLSAARSVVVKQIVRKRILPRVSNPAPLRVPTLVPHCGILRTDGRCARNHGLAVAEVQGRGHGTDREGWHRSGGHIFDRPSGRWS